MMKAFDCNKLMLVLRQRMSNILTFLKAAIWKKSVKVEIEITHSKLKLWISTQL
jgi:hypothetical protein